MDQFTNTDRARWFARYGDDYDSPDDAERDYAEYVAERDLARSIMGAAEAWLRQCDLKPEGDPRHVLSPEHAEQRSGDDMESTSATTDKPQNCPEWCTAHHTERMSDGRVGLDFHQGRIGNDVKLQIGQDVPFEGSEDSPFLPYIEDDQEFRLCDLSVSEIRGLAAALLVTADLMEVSA